MCHPLLGSFDHADLYERLLALRLSEQPANACYDKALLDDTQF